MASLLIFTATLFVGSTLLFLVQPMYGKMVLPLLGGSPSVWNTCMVFFQTALLAGYAYTHISTQRLTPRVQILLHMSFLLTPLLVLPIRASMGSDAPWSGNPILWLLFTLSVTVGLPFYALATGAPMLQRWFAFTEHPSAKDPYFLYAASNLGSMMGLIGYLAIVEPRWSLPMQSRLWTVGYVLYLALILASGLIAFRSTRGDRWKTRRASLLQGPRHDDVSNRITGTHEQESDEAGSNLQRWRWILLAFVPSSLMLGVTTYLSTDVAAVPLLWVAPLTLYLLSFMAAFARRRLVPATLFASALPILALLQLVVLRQTGLPLPAGITLHLATFTCVAMICHYRLADERPGIRDLTGFYLLMSVGGALGGSFNALIAPILFRSVAEYPLVLVVACALIRRPARLAKVGTTAPRSAKRLGYGDIIFALSAGAVALGIDYTVNAGLFKLPPAMTPALYGALALLCFSAAERPLRFSLSLGAVLLAYSLQFGARSHIIWQDRSFFGVLRVAENEAHNSVQLTHGTTVHGEQSLNPERRREALTYYHRTGPIGQAMMVLKAEGGTETIAVIGLGTGSLASYVEAGDTLTYYEIDPSVVHIASDRRYFSFLEDAKARGAVLQTVLGDARLKLADAPDGAYDLLVVDAFSSDAIPIHLMTREAVRLYTEKLSASGVIAVHISNRYLDLGPIIGRLASDAGLVCLRRADMRITRTESDAGKTASDWMLMARKTEDLGSIARDPRWKPVPVSSQTDIWTDDYSNILTAIRWTKR